MRGEGHSKPESDSICEKNPLAHAPTARSSRPGTLSEWCPAATLFGE